MSPRDRTLLYPWLLPLGVFGAVLGLYLSTLTDVHTFDALSYVLDVDRKPLAELFHPHHLAYGPFGALVRAVALNLGVASSAMLPLQVANALAGAAGAAGFALLTQRLTQRPALGALAALGLSGSYAFWYYAVEVEVYTIAALFLIVALAALLGLLYRPCPRWAAALGVAQGLAVLFHQTNVLLCVPVAAALLLSSGGRPHLADRRLWQLGLAYGLPLAAIVGVAYLGVGFGISGFASFAEVLAWARGYADTGWWGGPITVNRWGELGEGLAATFADPLSSGAIIGGGLLAVLLLNAGELRAHWRLVICLGLWLLTYGGFFLWWEPDNIEFWIASLPPFLLLLMLSLARRDPLRIAGAVVVASLGMWGLSLNLSAISARGDAQRDLQRQISAELAARSQPGDLLVVPDGLQELYLPYYHARDNVISLNAALFASAGDWPVACAALQSRLDITLASGWGVLLGDAVLHPLPAAPGEPPTPLERFGLQSEQIVACYAPYRAMLVPLELPPELPPYWHIPPTQQVAAGAGWDFRRGTWGWQLRNAQSEGLTAEGWRIIPERDPNLLSPPLLLQAEEFRAIEVVMSGDRGAAQLFLFGADGTVQEERSLRWNLREGDGPRSYLLPLDGISGPITRLRLDPVGEGDGSGLAILSVRLVR